MGAALDSRARRLQLNARGGVGASGSAALESPMVAPSQDSPRLPTSSRAPAWAGYMIPPAFLLLAVWFQWGPDLAEVPLDASAEVAAVDIDSAPRRTILGDPPRIHVNGFDRTCMECHRIFQAGTKPPNQLLQHGHIKLNHGINDQCANCHHTPDLDRLLLRKGETIAFGDVVQLCAKCHGPTYRDWERGAHGRTNGYWDESQGTPHKLKCTECHDPHDPSRPALGAIAPLPGPRTLRMGSQHTAAHGEEARDPLRKALQQALRDQGRKPDERPGERRDK